MPRADEEELDGLQWARFDANREHACATAEKDGWLQAVEFIRDLSGKAFVRGDEEHARDLRALANDMANEATTRFDARIRELLKESAAAERAHVAALEQG